MDKGILQSAFDAGRENCRSLGFARDDKGDGRAPIEHSGATDSGIYIPEEKIGVRIEDTFYVDATGKLIDFAEKLPHTPEEVEEAMRSR